MLNDGLTAMNKIQYRPYKLIHTFRYYLHLPLYKLMPFKLSHTTSDEFHGNFTQSMIHQYTEYFKMKKFKKKQVLKPKMSSWVYWNITESLGALSSEGSYELLRALVRSHRNLINIKRSAWPLGLSGVLSCYRAVSLSSADGSSFQTKHIGLLDLRILTSKIVS